MRIFKTPGVYRREIDLSDILVPAGISDGGIVIRARKGPVNRPVLVANDKEFIETFGEPVFTSGTAATGNEKLIPEYGYGSYAALEYLKESSTLYVVRDYDKDYDKYASIEYNSNLITSAGTGISGNYATIADKVDKISIIDNEAVSNGNFIIGALYPSTDGNSIAVTIEGFNSSADWKFNYDAYPIANSATSADFVNAAGDSGANMGTTSQNKYYPIASKVFKLDVYTKPTDVTWADMYNNSTDKASGKFRLSPVETFYGSMVQLQDGNKTQLFIEDIVNGNSQYIYVKKGENFVATKFKTMVNGELPVLEDITSKYVVSTKLGQLTGGTSKKATGLDKTNGWNLFEDRESVNVSILIGTSYNQTNKNEIARVAAKRMDCIATLQSGEIDDNTVNEMLVAEKYGYQAPSYIALYGGYSKVYDKYNDRNVYLPNSIFGASLMARCDNIADPWSAPAGIDRATMAVLDQKVIWSFDNIGKLYDKNINLPRFINGVGNVMWGQKTAQLKKSALDRINVRRNLLFIENNVERALLPFTFENNTDKTRLRIFSIVDGFLAGVQAGGGLTAYQVVCDETNNTSNVIDSNQLNVDLYVQPVRTAEFIQLTTVITRTGISFSEVRIPVA